MKAYDKYNIYLKETMDNMEVSDKFEKLNKLRNVMNSRKIEGYWYSKNEPHLPMPIPNQLTNDEAKEIYELIVAIENDESKCWQVHFLGPSTSRITGEYLGTTEYQNENWIWPEDFASHYVLKHKVKPSDDFLKFIGYL